MKGINLFKVKVGIFAAMFFSAVNSFGQQEVMYSQYMFNTLALNPAYAGSRDVLSITALGRYQWLEKNVPGAPQTQSFTVDMPFRNEKMGIGLIAYKDQIGKANNTGINLAYSYRFKLNERTTVSMGIQPTFNLISNNLADLANIPDPTDPTYVNGNVTKSMFNAGAGLFLSNDRSYIGLSVPQIIEQKISNLDNSPFVRRHYFLMAGLVFGKNNLKFKPSTMLRYTKGVGLGFDVNANFWFRDKIAFGVSGRKSQSVFSGQGTIDALVGMFELQLTPQLRLGYAYDVTTSKLNSNYDSSSGAKRLAGTPTHEMLLRYEFGFGKSKILTPRYF